MCTPERDTKATLQPLSKEALAGKLQAVHSAVTVSSVYASVCGSEKPARRKSNPRPSRTSPNGARVGAERTVPCSGAEAAREDAARPRPATGRVLGATRQAGAASFCRRPPPPAPPHPPRPRVQPDRRDAAITSVSSAELASRLGAPSASPPLFSSRGPLEAPLAPGLAPSLPPPAPTPRAACAESSGGGRGGACAGPVSPVWLARLRERRPNPGVRLRHRSGGGFPLWRGACDIRRLRIGLTTAPQSPPPPPPPRFPFVEGSPSSLPAAASSPLYFVSRVPGSRAS